MHLKSGLHVHCAGAPAACKMEAGQSSRMITRAHFNDGPSQHNTITYTSLIHVDATGSDDNCLPPSTRPQYTRTRTHAWPYCRFDHHHAACHETLFSIPHSCLVGCAYALVQRDLCCTLTCWLEPMGCESVERLCIWYDQETAILCVS